MIRRPHKYGAVATEVDGIHFPSKAEAARYYDLRCLERAGEIQGLRVHPRYPLVVQGETVGHYVADFEYHERGEKVVEDVKSPVTRKLPAYRLKCHLMRALYGITVSEVCR